MPTPPTLKPRAGEARLASRLVDSLIGEESVPVPAGARLRRRGRREMRRRECGCVREDAAVPKTPLEMLKQLVGDIEDMRTHAPDYAEEAQDSPHWFGGFSVGVEDRRSVGYGNAGVFIEWPNLSILVEEAKKVIAQGGGAS